MTSIRGASIGPSGPAAEGPIPRAWVVGLIAAATLVVFLSGATSEIVRGDEGYHIQFARAWYEGGPLGRPTHNPHYPSAEPPGYGFVSEPLWPFLLSLLWHVTGPLGVVAQAYQAAWYALLLAGVYGIGREVLGPRGALGALVLAISVPTFGAFGMLLYIDVPAAATIMLGAWLVLRKHPVAAGVALGLAYLTKRHTLLLAPGMVLWILMDEGTWRQRIGRAAMMLGFALLVILPDLAWRRAHVSAELDPASATHVLSRLKVFFSPQRMPSNLNNALDWLKYLGTLVPAGLVLYVARQRWRRGHVRILAAVGLFAVALVALFSFDTDIRYAMPAIGLVVVLGTAGLGGWWSRRGLVTMAGVVAFAHLGATAWTVHEARHLTPGQRAVFRYLREETPPDTLVLYPGEVVLTHADRPVVWGQLVDPDTGARNAAVRLDEYSAEKLGRVLRTGGVDYVCIDETRVFDPDPQGRSLSGYARSVVERLPTFPFLERVPGDWPGIELYRVVPAGPPPEREPEAPDP